MKTIEDPYKLAEAGLVHYTGDVDPLGHDGYWYNSSEWEKNGYASAVDVGCILDGPSGARHLYVSKLVINKPKDMKSAFDCCGVEEERQGDPLVQIEACKSYGHYDPDCSDYREPSVYQFIVIDFPEASKPEDFTDYARIHGAKIVSEKEVWELLAKLVGQDSCG